ncbi:MAG: hypothetical protein HQ461_04185, partial [Deltaproteobacteria bacterium]|nr:hypothetical protein [Deltaproteobacteria bacterium]
MTGGDFVRNVKQVIDLLRQIAEVAPDADTAAAARAGADACRRPVGAGQREEDRLGSAGEVAHAGKLKEVDAREIVEPAADLEVLAKGHEELLVCQPHHLALCVQERRGVVDHAVARAGRLAELLLLGERPHCDQAGQQWRGETALRHRPVGEACACGEVIVVVVDERRIAARKPGGVAADATAKAGILSRPAAVFVAARSGQRARRAEHGLRPDDELRALLFELLRGPLVDEQVVDGQPRVVLLFDADIGLYHAHLKLRRGIDVGVDGAHAEPAAEVNQRQDGCCDEGAARRAVSLGACNEVCA